MRFMLLFSRQGKLRLQKWYTATAERDKKKMVRELMQVVLARKPKMCSFLEWRDLKIVYKRWGYTINIYMVYIEITLFFYIYIYYEDIVQEQI